MPKCCASVPWGDWGRSRQCTKNATSTHEGKPYCGTHDPVKRSERDAESDARYRAKVKQKRPEWHGTSMYHMLKDYLDGQDIRERAIAVITSIEQD